MLQRESSFDNSNSKIIRRSNSKNIQNCSSSISDSSDKKISLSKFQTKKFSKKKKGLESNNTNINIIINNNPINYSSSSNKVSSFDEKYFKYEEGDTFVFQGDNNSVIDNDVIFDEYLKKTFKDETYLSQSKGNAFTLIPSKNIRIDKEEGKNVKKANKKMIELLKKANNEQNNEYNISNNDKIKYNKKRGKNISKKKEGNKFYFCMLLIINIMMLLFSISKVFEPNVRKLFFDNDHNNYIYKCNLLSKETNITINN